jgi:hypothetical protein
MTMPIIDNNRFRREIQLICNISSDVPSLFASLRVVLDRNIEYEGCSWFTIDPATGLPTSHTPFRSLPPEDQARFLEHEATVDDVSRFVHLGRDRPHVSLLTDATGGKLDTSARYREFLQPSGFEHELRVAFVREGACWGGVALYRRDDAPNFIQPEVKALAGVVEFLGEAIERSHFTGVLNREDDGTRAPGIIVLGPANRVDLISPPAEEWLTGLGVELGDAWSTVLPGDVYAIASQARRTGAQHFDAGPAVVRVKTASGDPIELHAALLEGEPQGPVAVIVEPLRGPGVAEAVAGAYGLSAEESAVLSLVLRDRPTDESQPVLDKLGVADRHEAVAKVYADHYAVALEERQGLTAEGWFDGIPHPLPVDDEEAEEGDEGDEGDGTAAANGSGAPA